MFWQVTILAAEQRRVLSRILQLVENQMVRVHAFHALEDDPNILVNLVFSSDEDKSSRIQALLYRLEGVISVSVEGEIEARMVSHS